MLPTRFGGGQPAAVRKSRFDGKQSLLPKPRRPGSTDRLSSEVKRSSASGHRSSSAEPSRTTYAGGRLSREASNTKLPINGRARSQQGERFGQSAVTPLRTNLYSRTTTTPVRTPSEDRAHRSWQVSLDRALAYVTVKDHRPISDAAWQRACGARVQAALGALGPAAGAGGGAPTLIRPLTIARFVDITASLLATITGETKLNSDNYVTKLPLIAKRLLYPGTVSKSWLKTVNALHAFPQALALIAYLLDLGSAIELPVTDDWLYLAKDDFACLRRDYLLKSWIRFQDPNCQYEDLNKEYLDNLKMILGNNEEKIEELTQIIKKYEACLEDEVEAAAKAEVVRRAERREALLAALRAERSARAHARSGAEDALAHAADLSQQIKQIDLDIDRASGENAQLKVEIEGQSMSVEERTRLKEEAEYAARVTQSKAALADQIEKMVESKELELGHWQTITLVSCLEYKQELIRLSAHFPDLATLAVDEKELMREECAGRVCAAVDALRRRADALAEERANNHRHKTHTQRKLAALVEETHAAIAELKCSIEREQQYLETEVGKEATEAAEWTAQLQRLSHRLEELKALHADYATVDADLHFWEKQNADWCSKLEQMREFIRFKRDESKKLLEEGKKKRMQIMIEYIRVWDSKLAAA